VKARAPKAVVSWSGGKDSCLAVHRAVAAGIRPQALLTAMIENGTRSRSHGLRLELLQAQARSLGLPLVTRATSWEDYDETMHAALSLLAVDGVEAGVFGDIDLEPHREWVAGVCARAGIEPFHPLWQEPRLALLAELLQLGYEAVVVAIKDAVLPAELLGRRLDCTLVEELVAHGIDACGEEGEYHTAVLDGPLFRERIRARSGARVLRDGYRFLDLVPAPAEEPRPASVYSPA
jgi:diphthine-ammonia ligase